MKTNFTDDQLIHLGYLYISNPALCRSGVTFLQFANHPRRMLDRLLFNPPADYPEGDEFLPPLPSQKRAAKKISGRYKIQDAVAGLHLDEDLQRDYPEAGHHGDAVTAPIHRRTPARRYKVGSHKSPQRRAVVG